MRKKSFIGLLTALLTFLLSTQFLYASVEITAPHGVLLDFETGEVLYEKAAHEHAYPASTTKMMTAILVIEKANLDDVVTVTEDLYVDGSSMYLLKGESFTVRELLQALLIRSANDAAEVLAAHVAGSVEAFVKMMNERAVELGAKNTHFTNPHGLPDKNHVTTAYDLAVIARHGMTLPLFREIVSTVRLTLDETEQTPEKRYYRNTNRFLWATGSGNQIDYRGKTINIQYDIVDGIKTGYTSEAQQCLVASSVLEGRRLISVILGAVGNNLYLDSRTLLDYGYENFTNVQLNAQNQPETEATVIKGVEEKVPLVAGEAFTKVLANSQSAEDVQKEVVVNEQIMAPVAKGDVLGKIIYRLNGEIIGEIPLIADGDVALKPTFFEAHSYLKYVLGFVVLFLVWQVILFFLRLKKRRRRYAYNVSRAGSYQFSKGLLKRR